MSKFCDGLLRAVVVHQGLTGGGGGNQRRRGGVVEHARQAQAGFVQAGDGIVGKERIGSTNQRQVMTQVLGGFTQVHRSDLIARCDALIERRKDAHAELPREGGLTDQ